MIKIITLLFVAFATTLTAQQTIAESDFENTDFGGWQTSYSSIEIQESHNRLAVTCSRAYTGTRHNLTNLTYTSGDQYLFSLDFNIGDTPGDVQIYLEEKDASGRFLDYYMLDDDLKTGSHTYAYTVNDNVSRLVLYITKGRINPTVNSTFYIDNFKFKEASFLSEEVSLVFTYDTSGNQIQREWVMETQTQRSSAKQLVNDDDTIIPEQLSRLYEQIKVYPNPTQGLLMFEWTSDLTQQIYRITVSQLSGTTWEVPLKNVVNNSLEVDLTNYSNGVFIVNFELINHKPISKKIIKNIN